MAGAKEQVRVRKLRIDEHSNGEARYTYENGSLDYVLSIWTKHIGRGEASGTIMQARFKIVEVINSGNRKSDFGIKYLVSTEELFYGCPDHENDKEIDRVIGEFEKSTGMTLIQFQNYYDKIHGGCPTCGGRNFAYRGGYPGETVKICMNCNDVCDVEFNEAAVV